MVDSGEWLSIAQAAAVSGLHPGSVARVVRSGRLPAHKALGVWVIARADFERYLLDAYDRPGRKSKWLTDPAA